MNINKRKNYLQKILHSLIYHNTLVKFIIPNKEKQLKGINWEKAFSVSSDHILSRIKMILQTTDPVFNFKEYLSDPSVIDSTILNIDLEELQLNSDDINSLLTMIMSLTAFKSGIRRYFLKFKNCEELRISQEKKKTDLENSRGSPTVPIPLDSFKQIRNLPESSKFVQAYYLERICWIGLVKLAYLKGVVKYSKQNFPFWDDSKELVFIWKEFKTVVPEFYSSLELLQYGFFGLVFPQRIIDEKSGTTTFFQIFKFNRIVIKTVVTDDMIRGKVLIDPNCQIKIKFAYSDHITKLEKEFIDSVKIELELTERKNYLSNLSTSSVELNVIEKNLAAVKEYQNNLITKSKNNRFDKANFRKSYLDAYRQPGFDIEQKFLCMLSLRDNIEEIVKVNPELIIERNKKEITQLISESVFDLLMNLISTLPFYSCRLLSTQIILIEKKLFDILSNLPAFITLLKQRKWSMIRKRFKFVVTIAEKLNIVKVIYSTDIPLHKNTPIKIYLSRIFVSNNGKFLDEETFNTHFENFRKLELQEKKNHSEMENKKQDREIQESQIETSQYSNPNQLPGYVSPLQYFPTSQSQENSDSIPFVSDTDCNFLFQEVEIEFYREADNSLNPITIVDIPLSNFSFYNFSEIKYLPRSLNYPLPDKIGEKLSICLNSFEKIKPFLSCVTENKPNPEMNSLFINLKNNMLDLYNEVMIVQGISHCAEDEFLFQSIIAQEKRKDQDNKKEGKPYLLRDWLQNQYVYKYIFVLSYFFPYLKKKIRGVKEKVDSEVFNYARIEERPRENANLRLVNMPKFLKKKFYTQIANWVFDAKLYNIDCISLHGNIARHITGKPKNINWSDLYERLCIYFLDTYQGEIQEDFLEKKLKITRKSVKRFALAIINGRNVDTPLKFIEEFKYLFDEKNPEFYRYYWSEGVLQRVPKYAKFIKSFETFIRDDSLIKEFVNFSKLYSENVLEYFLGAPFPKEVEKNTRTYYVLSNLEGIIMDALFLDFMNNNLPIALLSQERDGLVLICPYEEVLEVKTVLFDEVCQLFGGKIELSYERWEIQGKP